MKHGTPEEKAYAKRLYDDDISIPKIARRLGRHHDTVYKWVSPNRLRYKFKAQLRAERWRKNNPERYKELQRNWHAGYYLANKDAILARQRERRREIKDGCYNEIKERA